MSLKLGFAPGEAPTAPKHAQTFGYRLNTILARYASTDTKDTQSWLNRSLALQLLSFLGGTILQRMGSTRSTEDPAADTAAADAEAGPGHAAAAADQPSSSGQQFVNAGAVHSSQISKLAHESQNQLLGFKACTLHAGYLTWLERRRQWTQKPPDFKRTAKKRAHS
jgi:hypothetical protein